MVPGLLTKKSMRFSNFLPSRGPCGVHGRHALCGTQWPRAATSVLGSLQAFRRVAVMGLVLASVGGIAAQPALAQQPARTGVWAIEGTTVLDGRGGDPLTDAVLVVDRGVIRCVGARNRCPLFGISSVIDGRDLWVMPGLIDPDVRMAWTTDSLGVQDAQHIRLAVGITLVREVGTGGEVESNLRARKRASDPFRPEPKILVTGAVESRSARELGAKGLVDTSRRLARRSVDGLRVTGLEDGPQLDSIFQTARAWSIPVFGADPGHVLADDQVVALVERGVRAIGSPAAVGSGEEGALDSLAERSVAVNPGLAAVHYAGNSTPPLEHLRFLDGPRPVSEMIPLLTSSKQRRLAQAQEGAVEEYAQALNAVRRFVELGGTVLAGSGEARPGSGLLVELELLQDAGLEPSELISLATHGAARELGVDRRYGSIRPGLAADLLILESDPTLDIRNTRDVWRVVKSGVIYDPIQLLEPYRLRYERENRYAWKQRAGSAKWFLIGAMALGAAYWYRRKNAWRL